MKLYSFLLIGLLGHNWLLAQTKKLDKFEEGKKIYTQYCMGCHQLDGQGIAEMNPPIAKSAWVIGDKKRLINVLLLGLSDPIEMNGETYENPMPAQNMLTDVQIAAVLTYIRNNFGNKASNILPSEVKALRKGGKG